MHDIKDEWRVVVLGDPGVGKAALAVQFILDYFAVRVGVCLWKAEHHETVIPGVAVTIAAAGRR
ncbi:hypothetical protein GGX14DRAFT_562408 [Mycena pura]|uniref:Uncharacterized protein n=1 Tax=Mycena pura TaxID=153505 RepID=A0AAD6VKT8_9AGAR|nr:hypothetical protein GGX14DRAFT_562408 [Mycena pura]